MRVIAGEFRSRKLISLEGSDVRPTPDRLREALFSILHDEVRDAVFTDAYAGTGAVGIEALSRGARQAIFIEKDRNAIEVIKANLAALKIGRSARVIAGHSASWLRELESDIIFADPPYPKEGEYQAALDAVEDRPPRLLILQHSNRFSLPSRSGRLQAVRTVRHGENTLTFFRPDEPSHTSHNM